MPFILTAFGFVRGFIAKLSPVQLIIAALVTLAAFQHFHAIRLEHHTASLSKALGNEKLAHSADIARWKAASEAATANNKAQILHVTEEQSKISRNVSNDYQTNLAALRTSYGRLRNRTAPINQRPANGDRASPVPASPGPADGDGVSVPPDAALQSSEIELRLLYLQQWVRRQSAVDPNAKQ